MDKSDRDATINKFAKPVGITVAVILAIGAILYLLAIPFDLFIIKKVFDSVTSRIINLTGINAFLVKGIVILVLIPLLWVIPNVYFGKDKKVARAAILAYFAVFFLSLFFVSKDQNFAHDDGRALKYCAWTPEGLRCYDSPGFDTKFRIPLHEATPEEIEMWEAFQEGDIRPIDPTNVQFFNPFNGTPQVWYYEYPDGRIEFYDKPIKHHPFTGEPLRPVTKEIVLKWKEKSQVRAASYSLPEPLPAPVPQAASVPDQPAPAPAPAPEPVAPYIGSHWWSFNWSVTSIVVKMDVTDESIHAEHTDTSGTKFVFSGKKKFGSTYAGRIFIYPAYGSMRTAPLEMTFEESRFSGKLFDGAFTGHQT